MGITAAITAVASYLPDYVLTNNELAQMVDTNDEWIIARTGIKERRILKGKEKGASIMAAEAVKRLCAKRNISPLEIDLLLVATVTGDYVFPATSNIVCDMVGATNAWGYDINAACSGFLYTLITATQFIRSGAHKKVVVVGVDKMSSITDYTDRSTCILFGDGAGAVLLEPGLPEDKGTYGILDFACKVDGRGRKHLYEKSGGSVSSTSYNSVDNKEHFVFQEGPAVFKFAVKEMADISADMMRRNNLTSADISWLVPHQANKRIIDAAMERMGLDQNKVMITIQKYGNTTSGTIPICLTEYEKKLKKGDNLILSSFGGGYTWGGIYVKWGYDGDKL
jgi:3-oxoacyl-[acyl-carrier-protein] synthase-3